MVGGLDVTLVRETIQISSCVRSSATVRIQFELTALLTCWPLSMPRCHVAHPWLPIWLLSWCVGTAEVSDGMSLELGGVVSDSANAPQEGVMSLSRCLVQGGAKTGATYFLIGCVFYFLLLLPRSI